MSATESEDNNVLAVATGEEWEYARELLRPVKQLHPNFVAAIRTLVKDWASNKPLKKKGAGAGFEARRFLGSKTVQAAYYYASKSYYPELLTKPDIATGEPYLSYYSAFDHAAFLGYLCLFRAISRISDKEEWVYIQHPLYDALDLGAIIGTAIPKIGLGFGLMTRGVRYLCFAAFLWNSKKEFQAYRRHLKKEDLAFDLDFERRTWNCTTIELSTILLQQAGFNFGVSDSYYLALTGSPHSNSKFHERFKNAETWISSMMDTGEPPTTGVSEDCMLNEAGKDKLIKAVEKMHDAPERIEWLNKGKGSISPENTPELFARTVAPPAGEEEPPETL